MNQDPTQPIEPFLKGLVSSLDLNNKAYPNVEAYATQFARQLKPSSGVVLNGNPIVSNNSKLEFQKNWLSSPLTSHQIGNFDCHLIPGTGTVLINVTGKVRFDESGNSRLNESADLIQTSITDQKKPVWGSWFGFYLHLVVDETVLTNSDSELINNFDYRITYKPKDSVVEI
ncbi:mRNA transport regulator mtr2 [Yamadazyma tenuis]|uniref:NTF2 domain-containing protein n=1 Tax=Candida tenuis (strain ATCC 10573 / BCRC 21748 / CBS 615 / JCM 9827 / NBRC 10315 / NRRL Y-1498 / VKM Y-70) TaxID=590646 RepID=G3B0W0_CANTC|nr:uncharacterized protein CANTEDRAFT_120841 [Yamadazyma tenuis ATCC 10573]EGV64819.1 hypothetical protein CANTEDRAFT_120841 [Yamadazyma tenuis ATCC 10573]WEJ97610.1 mRNA transport regulator mtr2 [Yamadazyma tenuis]